MVVRRKRKNIFSIYAMVAILKTAAAVIAQRKIIVGNGVALARKTEVPMHELEIVFYPGCRGSVKRFGYLAGLFSDRYLQYRLEIDPVFPSRHHLLRNCVLCLRYRCPDSLSPKKKVIVSGALDSKIRKDVAP